MEKTYVQLMCQVLGLKLVKSSELPDAECAGQLLQVRKELREALITCGLAKRKKRKAKGATETPAKKGRK